MLITFYIILNATENCNMPHKKLLTAEMYKIKAELSPLQNRIRWYYINKFKRKE